MLTREDQEALLAPVLALAGLFSNCVEAFGNVQPSSHKWDRDEHILLSRLGIQQARLLIWGDILGISSPPAVIATSAVPLHPSDTYPDVNQPMFFTARDPRLDDPQMRAKVMESLKEIVDRAFHESREEAMEKYGLKAPKKGLVTHQPALDTNRLEGFREKYQLLQDVADAHTQLASARRSLSITQMNWAIVDKHKFANYILLIQEKVDLLIHMMDVQERIDRGVRVDIKSLGWHPSPDRTKTARDISKLRIIQAACQDEYPDPVAVVTPMEKRTEKQAEKPKRPGFLARFRPKSWSKTKTDKHEKHFSKHANQLQVPSPPSDDQNPPRSKSEAWPMSSMDHDISPGLEPVRSNSLSALPDTRPISLDGSLEADVGKQDRTDLARFQTASTITDADLGQTQTLASMISRHDMYHGPYRTATRELRQD
ncbi:hypothetical protein H2203_002215 [Taxawa tesnikishii (nom. ined.)]|nr:hypothetical protein H2203_002215 [Dothideales sp. JES 119]